MRIHVSLNLLNELEKRDKMLGLPSILSLFRNEFNRFNITGARMLDSINYMTLKYSKLKHQDCPLFLQRYTGLKSVYH